MTEFNLNNQREELLKILRNDTKESPNIAKVIEEIFIIIKHQDKEFIKRLKEEFCCEADHEVINKLAGEKLM